VGLVCIEDTHMPANGGLWPVDRLEQLGSFCRSAGIPVHLDGARLWHAEVATGVPMARLAGAVTTVMCCLSKGLCAPVGSLLAGPEDVIGSARVERSRMGGGMRQAGVLAAAGLVAMRCMIDRLADDHTHAARLAEAVVRRWPDAGLDPAAVRTNVVVFHHQDPLALLAYLEAHEVRAGTIAPGMVRMVTHHDVGEHGIARACQALAGAP
jgi:threonine aldolase